VIRRPPRWWTVFAALIGSAFAYLAVAAPAMANLSTLVDPDSTNAEAINQIYRAALGVTITIFVLVGGWLLYSAIRFRERPENAGEEPPQVHGSKRLEIGWTVVPILILIALCGYTFWKLPAVEDVPSNHININIQAQQFTFTATYPNGKSTPGAKITLVVPVHTPVELHITSKDVIHDWWVPALGQKVDAIPGQTNHVWFRANRTGIYRGQCDEFCGIGHADMLIYVKVVTPSAYQSFVNGLKS
jgi:cytochrome c oxidase subunit 2